MGTKENPGRYDCYTNALPDEPMFVLLARDPEFGRLVKQWADRRQQDIECGDRPLSDLDLVIEARQCAHNGIEWRRANFGKWRKPTTP
jgi:hypothetical protein